MPRLLRTRDRNVRFELPESQVYPAPSSRENGVAMHKRGIGSPTLVGFQIAANWLESR
jgi:hypothetical protein